MNNFNKLVSTIQQIHKQFQQSAANAVNQTLSIRNWLIGYYIVEFEQNGKDRADYVDRLIESISVELKHIKGIDNRSLLSIDESHKHTFCEIECIKGSWSVRELKGQINSMYFERSGSQILN